MIQMYIQKWHYNIKQINIYKIIVFALIYTDQAFESIIKIAILH